ncbi:hypothetical protein C7M84_017336 [Penaeus vannamei]|uniref:Uncharacterized protein n=1 Tax=Penaeus vannamei TaxID=6689 RepID=A0A3R7QEC8_PENVA|nr:UPF0488 protein C8orf33 homolog [Penaeus vannamei]ROT64705.1 hypothetical protein C7M84_017336 [Penaeus vannamei]
MPPKPRQKAKRGPPPKVVAKPSPQEDTDEAAALEKFALELRWCLQQIELSMEKKQGNSKQTEELMKSHLTLSNNKTPTVKKRQLMRSMFGDYRKKMSDEEKKFKIEKPKMNANITVPKQSKCVKKSTKKCDQQTVVNTTEDNSNEEAKETRISESQQEEIDAKESGAKLSTSVAVVDVKENPEVLPKPTDTFKFKATGNEFRFNFSMSE